MKQQTNQKSKIQGKLVSNIRSTNNFGYKILIQEDLNLITNWYSKIHQIMCSIELEQVKLFGSKSTMYAYLIMGLTNKGDRIIVLSHTDPQLKNCITNLGRCYSDVSVTNQDLQTQKSLVQKIQQSKLVLISHPNAVTGQPLQKKIILQVLQICQKVGAYAICDESFGDLCPDFESILPQRCINLMIIKQLGAIAELSKLNSSKHICIFKDVKIKTKCAESCAAALKILPGDLSLQLIKTAMSGDAFIAHEASIRRIKNNYSSLLSDIGILGLKKLPQKCNSQFVIMELPEYYMKASQPLKQHKQFQVSLIVLKDVSKNRFYIRVNLDFPEQFYLIAKNVLLNYLNDSMKPKL